MDTVIPGTVISHGAVLLVTDRSFAPVCRERERHVDQWLFREFYIYVSSLFSIVEYFNFSRPPSFDGETGEVGGTIMVTSSANKNHHISVMHHRVAIKHHFKEDEILCALICLGHD